MESQLSYFCSVFVVTLSSAVKKYNLRSSEDIAGLK